LSPTRPNLTVVIPAYNPGVSLLDALHSILAQSVLPQEIIVVDDGSTPPIGRLPDFAGVRHHLIRQENRGYGGAVNTGIRAATGEVIAFLDHDDIWLPGKTETQLNLMGPSISVVGGATIVVDYRSGEKSKKSSLVLASRVFGACMFRKTVLEQVGGLTEDSMTAEPIEWWSRFSRTELKVRFTEIPVLERRIHGENLGITQKERTSRDLLKRVRAHRNKGR